jgi:hypothetical protein
MDVLKFALAFGQTIDHSDAIGNEPRCQQGVGLGLIGLYETVNGCVVNECGGGREVLQIVDADVG